MDHLNSIQILLLGLITAIAAFAGLARRFALSYPIVLVVAGLLCSLIPHVPRVQLSPDLVFLVFLPPLLFAAAWQTSWREFKFNIFSIALLAFGLVFFTAIGVALTAHYFMPGFDWRLGFLLGAIVSPTDALAATSIAKRVGMPSRIVDILEGESLLNDATGLLALQFGVDMITQGATPDISHGLLQLLWLVVGGAAIGVGFGAAITWAEKWIDDGPVEIVVSLIVAYGSYLLGEAAHASGVMAVVACGLLMSRRSSTFFSPSVRLQAFAVWEMLEFLLNGLVFILIGLQLPYVLAGIKGYSFTRLAVYGVGFAGTLIVLRMLWMYPGARLAYLVRTRLLGQHYDPPTGKTIFVLGWTGMRGVVALAAAGSLPYTLGDGTPFPQRNMIVFLTFVVILVTLVLQGLSLPSLVRFLGLNNSQPVCEEGEARRILLNAAVQFLKDGRERDGEGASHLYNDLLHQYEHRLNDLDDCTPTPAARDAGTLTLHNLMLDTIRYERGQLIELRNTGRIGDTVLRTIERELDLVETKLLPQAD